MTIKCFPFSFLGKPCPSPLPPTFTPGSASCLGRKGHRGPVSCDVTFSCEGFPAHLSSSLPSACHCVAWHMSMGALVFALSAHYRHIFNGLLYCFRLERPLQVLSALGSPSALSPAVNLNLRRTSTPRGCCYCAPTVCVSSVFRFSNLPAG